MHSLHDKSPLSKKNEEKTTVILKFEGHLLIAGTYLKPKFYRSHRTIKV